MMKVAIVHQVTTPGGVQSCIIALIRGLNRRGIVPDTVWDVEPNWALLQNSGVQAGYRPIRFPIPTRIVNRLPGSLHYLTKAINTINGNERCGDYDFFYIFDNAFLVPEGFPHLRYLSGPPLLPQLVQDRKGLRGWPARSSRWLYQRALRNSHPAYEYHQKSRYVINSQYTARLFEEAHQVRLPVVYPPINLSGRSFAMGDLSTRDTVTFFSRVVSDKRPEKVIELASKFPAMRCVIMGSVPRNRQSYFDALKKSAVEMGRPDIEFLPTPSNEVVRTVLARTRYYVFPAINEHFGMTTPEAIASGAIPFVHDSGGQREIVPDPRLRFIDENFFAKFEELSCISDSELNLIRKALNAHVQQYSEEVYIDKMLSYLIDEEKGAVG